MSAIAPTNFDNCLLAPTNTYGEMLSVAITKFVTASYDSTHELKFLTQALCRTA